MYLPIKVTQNITSIVATAPTDVLTQPTPPVTWPRMGAIIAMIIGPVTIVVMIALWLLDRSAGRRSIGGPLSSPQVPKALTQNIGSGPGIPLSELPVDVQQQAVIDNGGPLESLQGQPVASGSSGGKLIFLPWGVL